MTQFEDIQNELKETDLGEYLSLEIVSEISHQRQERGLSQRELSRMSGVPQKTISRIETGLDVPTFDTLGKLMKALGCKPTITFEYD